LSGNLKQPIEMLVDRTVALPASSWLLLAALRAARHAPSQHRLEA
jgi:hypothetical protein